MIINSKDNGIDTVHAKLVNILNIFPKKLATEFIASDLSPRTAAASASIAESSFLPTSTFISLKKTNGFVA